jgi:hypothetical protein
MDLSDCYRWWTARLVAAKVFASLHLSISCEDLPPLMKGLLQQCATAELLGWLLDCILSYSCGKPPLCLHFTTDVRSQIGQIHSRPMPVLPPLCMSLDEGSCSHLVISSVGALLVTCQ